MVWINESELDFTPLVGMTKAKSGKGWILKGVHFDCFLWNSDKLVQQLLTAMASWCDTGEGKQLEIKASNTEKRGFLVTPAMVKGKPVKVLYRINEAGYDVVTEEELNESNPFL